ncbi:MAG: BamA/TamA family outer membrane protein [Elusimicrobiota bacterium]|jgi:hypothetical protein
MSRRARLSAVFLALCCAAGKTAVAQDFGRNQVVRRDFDWKVSSTEHFDIHHYEASSPLVPFAAKVLERSYAELSRSLGFSFGGRRKPFFLYASVNDMQQSTIVDAGDGTGGVTEPFKDRFVVYNDGSRQWLDEVATHELGHVFQFHKLVSGFWRSAQILKTLVYPLWFMEGMAEHFTQGLDDTPGEVLLRDAATSGGLIPLWKLEHFSHLKPHQVRLAYESGASALEFLEEQFGPGRIERMLDLFESRFDSSAVLQELTGLDIFAFDKKWREYLEDRSHAQARKERLREPESYGVALTTADGHIPQFDVSPVFTPDGASLAYFSTLEGFPPVLMSKDLHSGRTRKLMHMETEVETVELGRFADLSRVLAVSPDGRKLAFFCRKNHEDSLCFYDLGASRFSRMPVPGLEAASQPAFSPDGRSIAFSGLKEAVSDIYLLDLSSGGLRNLTNDPQDDQSPAFTPEGAAIVYSSEIETEKDAMPYQRRLYRLDLASGSRQRLLELHGAAKDPVVSTDGSRVLFSLEGDGFRELHELDLPSGRSVRLTRSMGAAYSPTYMPDGRIAFSAFRRGSAHIHAGERSAFLSEPDEGPLAQPAQVVRSTAQPSILPARPFRTSFDTDLFLPAFFYSSRGGLFWTSYWQGSDMLGVHQAQGLVTYASGQGAMNYQTGYQYGRWRMPLFVQAYGDVFNRSLNSDAGLSSNESTHVQAVSTAYPFDRFHRLQLVMAAVTDHRFDAETDERIMHDSRVFGASFIRDAVRGRYLVANAGSRLKLSYFESARVFGGNVPYGTLDAYGVQYLPIGDMSSVVLRGHGVRSAGALPPGYALGGYNAVRGFGYSTTRDAGSRLAMASAEVRFPVWGEMDYYMWYLFPDFYFKAITAAVFTDAGYASDDDGSVRAAHWRDVRHSYGAGLRVHTFVMQLFPLVIHFDYARRTNSPGGVFYVYLGPLF